MFEPTSTKKLVRSKKLPKIQVDVGMLCNLVTSVWSNSSHEDDIKDFDPVQHDAFMSRTKKCLNHHNQRLEDIEKLNYRFKSLTDKPNCLKQTESSKSKIKIDRQNEQEQEDTYQNIKTKANKKKTLHTESNADIHSVIAILDKAPIDRTKQEVKQGFKILKMLPALSHLSDFIITQILNVATLVKYDEAAIVFGQGEKGSAWYVILDGGVNIFVSPLEFLIKSRELDDKNNFELILKNSKRVAHLEKGYGFGELAMVNEAARAASVITTAKTMLLKMEKRDYIQILKSIHHQEIREKTLFLKRLSIISDKITLNNLASVFIIILSYRPW
jgi:hypothetical protein